MKTTKSRLFNIIIVCSVTVNLAAIGALCYIANINNKTDSLRASLDKPVIIYAPKAFAKPLTTALLTASAK
ncbi:MAG TPA: hypothetical protein VK742_04820 [Candidatus Sulfotelmatobacter sp.]|jgi:hypothetical protein|nr:hypothetical protein [Candidatus Sulfotelmatobacter sp.]